MAIEPSSGEILSMISGPTYNPALLVGRQRSKNYTELYYDSIAKPTWDRSILAEPSPGSPFKTLNAMIALQEGVITEDTGIPCNKSVVGCHNHPSAQNVSQAVPGYALPPLQIDCLHLFERKVERHLQTNFVVCKKL